MGQPLHIVPVKTLEAIHVFCELGFQIGCLVLMNDIVLGQLVKHGDNFCILFSGSFLFSCTT